MAFSNSLALTILIITIATIYLSTPAFGLGGGNGRFVGGRTVIKDVKTNKEVQDLGRFSVNEFNLGHIQSMDSSTATKLTFKEVVKAEKQVVSGMKYYLTISANQDESQMMYDSVVVVKPWDHSVKVIGFSPSHSH